MEKTFQNRIAGPHGDVDDARGDSVDAAPNPDTQPATKPTLTPEELKNALATIDAAKEPARYEYLTNLLKAYGLSPDPQTTPATQPTEMTPTAVGFRIRFCGWCKQIDIRGPRRDSDVISLLIIGKRILAAWNGKVMIIQDGICEACSKRLHPRGKP